MIDLTAKVAVVTGAGSGIGRACAARYVESGATVIVTDVDDDIGGDAADAIGAAYRHLDVASSAQWTHVVDEICEHFGRIDLLHLNAGIRQGHGDITALTDDDYGQIIGVNQNGVFFGIRAGVPALSETNGAMLVTASRASLGPLPNDLGYSMSKHAVVGLVRSIAPDLESRGITINAICPATVDTGFIGAAREQLEAAGIEVMSAEEVAAGAIEVLASGRTGLCWSQLPGASPEPFEFASVPGR
jgi:NAD(P)-dependent dehydrogenase (short-subunit alcohol dehydrogenase family)